MYLKELTLRGFKSFASATTLRFEPGITAVVGPNGSGKSNIVDALTWVMGEQGAKNLRGTSMEDVIFAGTSSRPPLGRAQVSLTIDNSDHTLNIDYTEVTISRTIFRNGGSEYAINGSACRLLDIQELLSDTGLGQQMHVIVGQGRLDSILKADPSGHRAFIEEAAGILKHRKRKERALRKLANTETNLARLDDLLGEIRRQLGPLGRQARISRRADGIQVTLRDAQSRLYADDALQIMRQRDDIRANLHTVRAQLAAAQQELARTKVHIERIEALNAQSSPALAAINQTWHELSRLEERLRSLASIAQERAHSMSGQLITAMGDDPQLLNQRADELETLADQARASVQDTRMQFDHAIEQRADDEKQLASIRQTLTELRRTVRQRETTIANLREKLAREEAAVQLAHSRVTDFTTQHDSLTAQRADAITQRGTLERTANSEDTDDGSEALDAARSHLSDAVDALNELQDQQRKLNGTIISLQAKADALRDTLESRNASGSLEHDAGVGALGHLTDFIHVAEGWEEAIARALNDFANAVIVPNNDALRYALNRAREDRWGRAVVLRADDTASDASDHADMTVDITALADNAVIPAANLISVNPDAANSEQARNVVRSARILLADTAAVHTLEQAVAVTAQADATDTGGVAPQFTRAVTQAGEIVNTVGAVGGSALSQSDLSLAARRDAALKHMRSLQVECDAIEQRIETARAERDQARLAVDQAAAKRTEARVKAEQAAAALRSAHDRIAGLERQIRALDAKITTAHDDAQAHQRAFDELSRALDSAQNANSEHANADELTAREHELETSLTHAREREITAKIAWKEAERKAESYDRQIGLLRDQAKEAVERRARIEAMNARKQAQAARAQAIAQDATAVAQMVAQAIADVTQRRETLQARASGHDEELKQLRAERDALEPQVAQAQRREHELDVDRERAAGEYGRITQKIADDLGMSVDELVREYNPSLPVPVLDDDGRPVPLNDNAQSHAHEAAERDESESTDAHEQRYQTVPYVRAEQVKRLEKAKRDLAALGKVNPLAAEEYEALETRNRYLNEQRDDVVKSRDDLMQLIRELDSTMVSVFQSAFDDTAAAFENMFSTLFPGGTGRLRLENPADMLTTGVIVEASPAGKRVKQLSLLSGGERSLTALALLFAIFTARPSPFYVMDEVEAALDDVNLTRLINAFNELRSHAQLIIITHQQRTMSIADALYGITMRSDGVTAVVSQKLERD
ncbi:chromosome segregation protein SMC [Bifidobacterium goeldii]|uniref:Chromosome partition protein Smc n=1 Tax=Bifidobacterium goeldii TaxID=2306975 RepID=A0A430FN30_9BIFI|nr:chromosome segregation protein SMC [Bifidobacterium goeldii]RSX54242.1 chromosome segregation protein SMC [Bifidobacterium goeldii]